MNAAINVLLNRLERVEKSGSGWRAKCPAHDGKSTSSLSIAVGDDGRVLIHDFGGCDALSVVNAVGLELTDLFPVRITHKATKKQRRELQQAAKQSRWAAACSLLEREATVVWVAGRQIKAGEPLNLEDELRLDVALDLIRDAKQVLRGR